MLVSILPLYLVSKENAMKIAVVTDSNSGITQDKAKEMGVFVIPMPFMINDVEYFEDINLTQDEFYKMLEGGAEVVTSQPSPEAVTDLWDEILKSYDEIVHIPMSSGLSGSCQTAKMLAEDYEGKVCVVNNQRISVTQRQSVLDALALAEKGHNASEIARILEEDKFNSSIYIMVGTLDYLKRGGRITPAVATIGSLLKIKPVLQIQGERLDSFAMARTVPSGKQIMINAIKKDIEKRFFVKDYSDLYISVAHSHDEEAASLYMEELKSEFPGASFNMDPLSLSVACHIGPMSLAATVTKKLK